MSRNKHPVDVKGMVHKRGETLASLARRHGVNESTARKCLYRPLPTGNRLVAEYLGKQLHELWPEWFDKHGNRRSSASNDTSVDRCTHRQKSKAA